MFLVVCCLIRLILIDDIIINESYLFNYALKKMIKFNNTINETNISCFCFEKFYLFY